MPVSLKHPDRPDPSEVAAMALREYTPEHLTDEIYPQNSERVYTPIHQSEEKLPVDPSRECTPIHITSEEKQIHAAAPEDPKPVDVSKSDNSVVSVILLLVYIAALIVVTVLLCTMLPVDTATSSESTLSVFSDILSDCFSFILSSPLIYGLLALSILFSCLSIIRRLIDRF